MLTLGRRFLIKGLDDNHQLPMHLAGRVGSLQIASGLAVATVNKDIRTLRHIFNLAIEPRGYLAEGQNPFAKIRERKETDREIRYVTTREYHALMTATQNIWWKALFSVAYGCGLRREEILHLTWVDIDFEKQQIKVSASKGSENILEWEPKSRRNRVVPMPDETGQLLADIQAQAREGHPYIFVSHERLERIKERRKIGRWNPRSALINNLSRDFHVIHRRANVSECTLHDLRRSAITHWAQRLPIQVVQVLAGHSNITTTRKYYLAVRSEDLQSASKWLNKILTRTHSD